MKIKVCGLRDAENIGLVAALKPDYMGFIFYKNSPRFVNEPKGAILKGIPAGIGKTAVFVNETAENIDKLLSEYGFDFVQLHGEESPRFCELLKPKVKVIKAFGINPGFDFEQLKDYVNKVDYFLFDTKTDIYGGSGKTFNWSALNEYKLDVPFFLSGGISKDNISEIENIRHPMLYGVDLNSKFESSPGIKNIEQLENAFKTIKATEHELRG